MGGYALKPESKWRKKSTVEPEDRARPWESALEDGEGLRPEAPQRAVRRVQALEGDVRGGRSDR